MQHVTTVAGTLTEDVRSRILLEAVQDCAIYMLDTEGAVVSWNQGAQRLKGYTASEITGQHFSRFYTEEDRAIGLPATALHTAEHEGRFENTGWRVRKDGSRFWAHVILVPIREPTDGALIGFAKITRDLTDRKIAEDALRRSEEHFRLLVQGVTDYAIYMLDPNGIITNWNAGAERIKGYLPEEIIGQHFSRFYSPEDSARGEPQKGLETAAREGRFEKEGWRIRKDGTRFWAHVVVDPIRNESGVIIGFAKITRDITERRQAQIDLEKAREALFHAQKMEMVGQLTGGVAHDFNNLLTAVLGSLELMRKRLPADPKLAALLENAVEGAQRGAALTQRMLAFARRQPLNAQAVDVRELVAGMSALLERSLGSGIQVETRFPLALCRVNTDPIQFESALLNLAVNARDAMPLGGVLVISAREEMVLPGGDLAPGNYVCLSVTDTGTGMDEATLQRATEPFFTTKDVGQGTGLGLSMVHGLAEQSGGRLVLKSQKDEGTVAEIWLPAAKESDVVVERAAAPAPDREHGKLRVLAVDDDGLVLMNTEAMLEDLGHVVLSANSAAEALEVLREERIDLLITDYAMPHMTGAQLADAVRAERPDLPIVLATGYAELPGGGDASMVRLAKPFFLEHLATAINDALRSAGRRVLHAPA